MSSDSDTDLMLHTRKRSRNEHQWKISVSKSNRNRGLAYTSRKDNVAKDAVVIGAYCKCKLKCMEEIGDDQLNAIFTNFWALGDYGKQNQYLSQLVVSNPIKNQFGKSHRSRRSVSYRYSLKFDENQRKDVCQTAFVNTHGITGRRMRTVMMKTTSTGTVLEDARGKKTGKIIGEVQIEIIRRHIKSLRTTSSHYSRAKSPNRKYLPPGTTLPAIYKQYVEKHKEQNGPGKPVKESYYRFMFNTEFNIGVEPPQSDTCNFCDGVSMKVASLNEERRVECGSCEQLSSPAEEPLQQPETVMGLKNDSYIEDDHIKLEESAVEPEIGLLDPLYIKSQLNDINADSTISQRTLNSDPCFDLDLSDRNHVLFEDIVIVKKEELIDEIGVDEANNISLINSDVMEDEVQKRCMENLETFTSAVNLQTQTVPKDIPANWFKSMQDQCRKQVESSTNKLHDTSRIKNPKDHHLKNYSLSSCFQEPKGSDNSSEVNYKNSVDDDDRLSFSDSEPETVEPTGFDYTQHFSKVTSLAQHYLGDVRAEVKGMRPSNGEYSFSLSPQTTELVTNVTQRVQEDPTKLLQHPRDVIDLSKLVVHTPEHPESAMFFSCQKLESDSIQNAGLNILQPHDVSLDAVERTQAASSLVLLDLVQAMGSLLRARTKNRDQREIKRVESCIQMASALAESSANFSLTRALQKRRSLRSLACEDRTESTCQQSLLDSPLITEKLFPQSDNDSKNQTSNNTSPLPDNSTCRGKTKSQRNSKVRHRPSTYSRFR